MQDYEVVRHCIEGNKECYGELVDRYKKLVFSLALNSLKDPQLAEDASQEVFIKAYTHLASYNPEFRFSTWIARIATNTCTDMLRKKRDLSPIDDAFEVADSGESPEERVIGKEKKQKLEAAIGRLDVKYRQPLMLYHISGLKYEEISEFLKVPMSIVKNRIFRARKILKELMEGF